MYDRNGFERANSRASCDTSPTLALVCREVTCFIERSFDGFSPRVEKDSAPFEVFGIEAVIEGRNADDEENPSRSRMVSKNRPVSFFELGCGIKAACVLFHAVKFIRPDVVIGEHACNRWCFFYKEQSLFEYGGSTSIDASEGEFLYKNEVVRTPDAKDEQGRSGGESLPIARNDSRTKSDDERNGDEKE